MNDGLNGVLDRSDASGFRRVTPGIESLPGRFHLPRHRHLHAYASVVLAGCFEESGYCGRIRALPGDVLIHPSMDCHANNMVSSGTRILRLEWRDVTGIGGLYHVDQVDQVVRVAERDVHEAAHLLERLLSDARHPSPGRRNDWPDLLLADLARDPSTEIGAWAEAKGLARETVSRRFRAAYSVTPKTLRAELRARAAWLRITRGSDQLGRIAAETGFADQAHMTRWIHHISGAAPSAWRRHRQGT